MHDFLIRRYTPVGVLIDETPAFIKMVNVKTENKKELYTRTNGQEEKSSKFKLKQVFFLTFLVAMN